MTTDVENNNDDSNNKKNIPDETAPSTNKAKCCNFLHFGGEKLAIGYNIQGGTRGAIIMSNIFLSTAFLYLASEDANCITEDGVIDNDCKTRVYGFYPVTLLSNIAVISGLIAAFCMPVIGAIVDYTTHRTTLGIVVSALIVIIQAVQIGTVLDTYFIMAILQAIAAFFYQALILVNYSFLPRMARNVGKDNMREYCTIFTMTQFSCQAMYTLSVIIVAGFIVGTGDDILTAQISQGMNVAMILPAFYFSWKRYFPKKMPKSRELPEGHWLWTEGFRQNWRTVQSIRTRYKKSLGFYFLTLCFAEAGTNAFTTVANIFLIEALGLSGQEVGLFFLVVLVFTLPGSKLGNYVTRKTNASISWRLSMLCLAIVADVGVFLLDLVPPELKYLCYIWGACVGIFIGWFYPVENYFFSLIVPKEQEAELSGFYVYCSQIIVWLPPLFFSIIVENGYNQKWGVLAVTGFHFVSILILTLQAYTASSWEEIVTEKGEEGVDTVDIWRMQ